jgi:hypothetical protein
MATWTGIGQTDCIRQQNAGSAWGFCNPERTDSEMSDGL